MNREVFVRRSSIAFVLLLLTTVMFVFAAGCASADTDGLSAPVSGKVVDPDGNALSGIDAALENGTPVSTDGLGNFEIMRSPGEHTLTISGSSISERELPIYVGDSGLAIGNIEVMRSSAAAYMTMNLVLIGLGLAITVVVTFAVLKRKKAIK